MLLELDQSGLVDDHEVQIGTAFVSLGITAGFLAAGVAVLLIDGSVETGLGDQSWWRSGPESPGSWWVSRSAIMPSRVGVMKRWRSSMGTSA